MVGKLRLTKPTFGVAAETGLATAVPAGQIVEIPIAARKGDRTVDVLWNGKKVMMFVSDLRDRSQPIDSRIE
ncbi:hypothetical protein ACFPT7_05685 [Acidicapsa dinghuensis]|uniref:Uncharacterized protein n=1 Tax=Acidicapsa dinghuensis TaxID=2218256 RepID=A0ABW1EEU9_9BACT|nr:hypothetical protein [Acidicapsa dinghuensis]